jgi:hypothetical protein
MLKVTSAMFSNVSPIVAMPFAAPFAANFAVDYNYAQGHDDNQSQEGYTNLS